MSWAALTGAEVRAWHSALESARFGLDVGRVVVGYGTEADVAEARLREELLASSDELVIARWPAAMTRLGAVAADARRTLPADTLTYWEIAPRELARPPRVDEGLEVVRPSWADAATADVITSVVRDSFTAYGSHYSANPRLDAGLALDGYVEWAVSAFRGDPGNVVLLRRDRVPVGLATLTRAGSDLEVELAGLTPAAQGRGLYGHLLAAVGRIALEEGLGRVIISTQVHNVRVQRAWVRAGLKPFAAVTTIHAMTR